LREVRPAALRDAEERSERVAVDVVEAPQEQRAPSDEEARGARLDPRQARVALRLLREEATEVQHDAADARQIRGLGPRVERAVDEEAAEEVGQQRMAPRVGSHLRPRGEQVALTSGLLQEVDDRLDDARREARDLGDAPLLPTRTEGVLQERRG